MILHSMVLYFKIVLIQKQLNLLFKIELKTLQFKIYYIYLFF